MKSFNDPALFRVIDMLVAAANPPGSPPKSEWTEAGVDWSRDRHIYSGAHYSFTTEVCMISRSGSQSNAGAWRLLCVKEHWRTGNDDRVRLSADTDRHVRWARLVSGSRKDALGWLRGRQTELEKGWENLPPARPA